MIDSGSFVTNTISTGAGENELFLTFTFQWVFPDGQFEPGTKAYEEKFAELVKQAAQVVPHTVEVIREWAKEGQL